MSDFIKALIEKADAVDPKVLRTMHLMKEPAPQESASPESEFKENKRRELAEEISGNTSSHDNSVENSEGAFKSMSQSCPFCGHGDSENHGPEHEKRTENIDLKSFLRHLIRSES